MEDAAKIAAVWLVLWTSELAHIGHWYSQGFLLGFPLLCLAVRKWWVIAPVAFVMAVVGRFTHLVGKFHDQHYIQWFSISHFLDGHNLYNMPPNAHATWSLYMPTGDLFGGILIAAGLHEYWLFWHVAVALIYLLPFLARPGLEGFLVFLVSVNLFSLANYTNSGGTVEVGAAAAVLAFHLFRRRAFEGAAIAGAYSVMFRQSSTLMAPFFALILWKQGARRELALFLVCCVLFGGLFIALDPAAFRAGPIDYHERVGAQMFFNEAGGMQGNFSIAAVMSYIGVPFDFVWKTLRPAYPLAMLGLTAILWLFALRTADIDRILIYAGLAALGAYMLARGYTHFVYIVAGPIPLLMFAVDYRTPSNRLERAVRVGLTGMAAFFGLVPLVLWAVSAAAKPATQGQRVSAVVTHTPPGGTPRPVRLERDHPGIGAVTVPLGSTVEMRFPQPHRISALRLSGPTDGYTPVQNVPQWVPSAGAMAGAVTRGEIHLSEDGERFVKVKEFRLAISHNVYPTVIPIPSPKPVRAVRIIPVKAYEASTSWTFQDLEAFE